MLFYFVKRYCDRYILSSISIAWNNRWSSVTVRHDFMCDRQDSFLPVTMTGRFSNFNSISYKEYRKELQVTGTRCRLRHDVLHWWNIYFRGCEGLRNSLIAWLILFFNSFLNLKICNCIFSLCRGVSIQPNLLDGGNFSSQLWGEANIQTINKILHHLM